jgi:hypothetical protein
MDRVFPGAATTPSCEQSTAYVPRQSRPVIARVGQRLEAAIAVDGGEAVEDWDARVGIIASARWKASPIR